MPNDMLGHRNARSLSSSTNAPSGVFRPSAKSNTRDRCVSSRAVRRNTVYIVRYNAQLTATIESGMPTPLTPTFER